MGQFLSTPSARRATVARQNGHQNSAISIHALCEEGDIAGTDLRTERRKFLSTPSARRATLNLVKEAITNGNFYPRPLRGGRPFHFAPDARPPKNFYPRPLRGGRLQSELLYPTASRDFYPRPLRGGRPIPRYFDKKYEEISIHALCEEGDSKNRDKISIFKQIIQHSARI